MIPSFAAWPSWMTFAIIVILIGPIWRLILGSRGRASWNSNRALHGRGAERQIQTELESRDQVIEDLQRRLTEMESRLDFTERLLAERSNEQKEPTTLGG
jgi:hypothetical protein